MPSRLIGTGDLVAGGFNGLFDQRTLAIGPRKKIVAMTESSFRYEGDRNTLFRKSGSGTTTVTIAAGLVSLPTGSEVEFMNSDAGALTLEAEPTVILLTSLSGHSTPTPFAGFRLTKLEENVFWLTAL